MEDGREDGGGGGVAAAVAAGMRISHPHAMGVHGIDQGGDSFLDSVSSDEFGAFLFDPAAKPDSFAPGMGPVGAAVDQDGSLEAAGGRGMPPGYMDGGMHRSVQSYVQQGQQIRVANPAFAQPGGQFSRMGMMVNAGTEYRPHPIPGPSSAHPRGVMMYAPTPQIGFIKTSSPMPPRPAFKANHDEEDHKRAIADKRRNDRNAREQRRSLKISQQIEQLKSILQNSGVDVKANKYNILSGVAEYIQNLQRKTVELDQERIHWQKLRALAAQPATAPTEGSTSVISRKGNDGGSTLTELDFKCVFMHACVPMALAFVDGRLCECNLQFECVSGYTKGELSQLTVFNLLHPDELQDTFSAVGLLLNSSHGSGECRRRARLLGCNSSMDVLLTLVRDNSTQSPRYFHVTLMASADLTKRQVEESKTQNHVPLSKQEKLHRREDSTSRDLHLHERSSSDAQASSSGQWLPQTHTLRSPTAMQLPSVHSFPQNSTSLPGSDLEMEVSESQDDQSLASERMDEPPTQIRRKDDSH